MALAINLVVNADGTVNIDKVAKQIGNLDNVVNESSKNVKNSSAAHSEFGSTLGGVKSIVTALTSGYIAMKSIDLAKSILTTNIQMENYATTLGTVMRNQDAATQQMRWIRDFAASTPFEFPELVDASVKLRAYGMDAQQYMTILGDTAAAMGKDLNSAVEMVADAANGEFERMKEFGLRASDVAAAAGYETVRDMTATRNDLIRGTEAMMSILESRYSGGMEKLSKNVGGMLSNMKDYWTDFQTQVGDAGVFDYVKAELSVILEMLDEWSNDGSMRDWAQTTSDAMIVALKSMNLTIAGLKVFADWNFSAFNFIEAAWWGFAATAAGSTEIVAKSMRGLAALIGDDSFYAEFDKMAKEAHGAYENFKKFSLEAQSASNAHYNEIKKTVDATEEFFDRVNNRMHEYSVANAERLANSATMARELNAAEKSMLDDMAAKEKSYQEERTKKAKDEADKRHNLINAIQTAANWAEDNITDKFLSSVELRKDKIQDEYRDRQQKLDNDLYEAHLSRSKYDSLTIKNRELLNKRMAELDEELATARAESVRWMTESLLDYSNNELESSIQKEKWANEERIKIAKESVKNGAMTQDELSAYIISSETAMNVKIKSLRANSDADRISDARWVEDSLSAYIGDSLEHRVRKEEDANQVRLANARARVAEGKMTEDEYNAYIIQSTAAMNDKISDLRDEDIKDQREKRIKEIAEHLAGLSENTKNSASFFDYVRNRSRQSTRDFLTEHEKQVQDWEKYYDTLEDLTDDFSRSSRDMISSMLFDGVKGNMQSFQTYWQSFWDSLLKSVTDTIAKMVVEAGTETVVDYFMSMLSSYDVGSYEIDRDQLALIHAGEMIIPAGEAQTFRDALESNTGLQSLAEANPAAYSSFTNAAMSNFASGGVKHVAMTLGAGINLGIAPADIATAMVNPAFWASNAVFAGWEGAEAAAETSMGIEGNALSEKVGNFAGMLGMATGLTPAGFMGVLASKAISTVVDMAVGAVQVAMARSYAEQMATAGTVSSMFDSLADALNARPYESYLDKIETETPDMSIADKYAEARDRESFVHGYYADLFNSISSTSLKQQLGFNDIDSWAANAALSLGYGRVSSGGSGFGGGSFGDRYGSGWASEATKSLGYGTSPFGGNYSFGYNDHGIGGGDDDSDGSDGSGGDDSSGSDSSGRSRSKFHTGGYLGLRNDEGFFIGQEGEGVVSKPGMELLDAINSGKLSTDKNSLKQVEQLLTQILLKITELNQTQNEWNENGVPVVTS